MYSFSAGHRHAAGGGELPAFVSQRDAAGQQRGVHEGEGQRSTWKTHIKKDRGGSFIKPPPHKRLIVGCSFSPSVLTENYISQVMMDKMSKNSRFLTGVFLRLFYPVSAHYVSYVFLISRSFSQNFL